MERERGKVRERKSEQKRIGYNGLCNSTYSICFSIIFLFDMNVIIVMLASSYMHVTPAHRHTQKHKPQYRQDQEAHEATPSLNGRLTGAKRL